MAERDRTRTSAPASDARVARSSSSSTAARLARPARQVDLGGALGVDRTRRLRCGAPRGVVVETDGGEFHDSITDREHTTNDATARSKRAGWTVLRFSWIDVVHRPTSVVRTLRTRSRRAA